MPVLALGLVGAGIGSAIGGTFLGVSAAAIGWSVGTTIGQLAFQKGQTANGPRVGDLSVQSSTFGKPMPYGYGATRLSGNVIYCTDKREVKVTTESGKGGPKVTSNTYTYNVDIAIDLYGGEVAAIRKIWSDGKLIFDVSTGADPGTVVASTTRSAGFKIYYGTETQLPDPTIEAAIGVGRTPAYRGRCYVVFTQLDCPNGQIPQMSFELLTVAGNSVEVSTFAVLKGSGSLIDNVSILPTEVWQVADPVFGVQEPTLRGGLGYATVAGTIANNGSGYYPVESVGTPAVLRVATTDVGKAIDFIDLRTGVVTRVHDRDSTAFDYTLVPVSGFIDDASGLMLMIGHVGGAYYCYLFLGVAVSYFPLPVSATTVATRGGFIYVTGFDAGDAYIDTYDMNGVFQDRATVPATPFSTYVGVSAHAGGVFFMHSQSTLNVVDFYQLDGTLIHLAQAPVRTDRAQFYADERYAIVSSNQNANGFKLINFRAVSNEKILVRTIIQDQCSRAGLDLSSIDVTGIDDEVEGYSISRVASARANIEPILKAFFIDVFEEDELIKFVKRADRPLVDTIAFQELGANDDGNEANDPLPLVRTEELSLPSSVTINYLNVDTDYQMGTESSRRQITDSENDIVEEIPFSTSSDHAKTVADVLLFDAWSQRNKRSGKLTRKYANLSPGDQVLFEYPEGSFRRRQITRVTDTGVLIEFDCIDADSELYLAQGQGADSSGGQTVDPPPSPTQMMLLDIPILRDADDNAGIYVALDGMTSAWPGATLFIGLDDASLQERGSVDTEAPMGYVENALGNWQTNTIDETNSLIVNVGDSELNAATRDAVVNGIANASAVGAPGRWEILQFIHVDDLGNGRFRLSGFKRGQRGTERFMGTHTSIDAFVLLVPRGMLRPGFDVSSLNQVRYYRAITNGLSIDSSSSITAVNTGQGLEPFAGWNARKAVNLTTNDLTITWGRRTRLSENWLAGVLPLGEASEAYEVDIHADASFTAVKRTLSSSTSSVVYTSAQQVADFGSNQSTIYVTIYQISDTVGRGNPLQVTL